VGTQSILRLKIPEACFPAASACAGAQLEHSSAPVAKQLKKVKRGEKLSPVLLVRVPDEARLLVADGYHRVCAAYLRNEDEPVPCQIA
jgi:hypothetical protein